MTVAALVNAIEKAGGKFVVQNRQVSLIWPDSLSVSEQQQFCRMDRQARSQAYGLTAWLLEREASRKWEVSGKDPQWWKSELDAQEKRTPAATE